MKSKVKSTGSGNFAKGGGKVSVGGSSKSSGSGGAKSVGKQHARPAKPK